MGRTMIPFDDALAQVLANVPSLPSERVALAHCVGRTLAEDVRTDMDFPPFDKACMDGFACRQDELGQWLDIIETVPAGKVPERPLLPGQATRIMTGAMVPDGADVVFMVEYAEESGERVRFVGDESQPNIAWCGEDLRVGDPVLAAGTTLEARHVAVLASVGVTEPLVARCPRVGIIATGDELVEPNLLPSAGQIRNSNSAQLIVQSERAGAVATYYGISLDVAEAIEATLKQALVENDLVLLSGGVSMGDFDLVPAVMTRCGVTLHFDQVAVKPGKPVTFGTASDGVVFGMPGNPVSTFVIFELFVRPWLRAAAGDRSVKDEPEVCLAAAMQRRRAERLEFVPVRIDNDGKALPVRYHGSAHFFGLSQADGLVRLPIGVSRLEAGTPVRYLTI